jgi:hypothetical protein
VRLSSINGNFATNNARNFLKIPGVNIWENEGSGIQINVGVRGLSRTELGTKHKTKRLRHFFRRFGYPSVLQPTNGGG